MTQYARGEMVEIVWRKPSGRHSVFFGLFLLQEWVRLSKTKVFLREKIFTAVGERQKTWVLVLVLPLSYVLSLGFSFLINKLWIDDPIFLSLLYVNLWPSLHLGCFQVTSRGVYHGLLFWSWKCSYRSSESEFVLWDIGLWGGLRNLTILDGWKFWTSWDKKKKWGRQIKTLF